MLSLVYMAGKQIFAKFIYVVVYIFSWVKFFEPVWFLIPFVSDYYIYWLKEILNQKPISTTIYTVLLSNRSETVFLNEIPVLVMQSKSVH